MVRHNMNQPGKSLGVVGLGGLGHLAVKFGKAFGLKVTVFSTSVSKRDEALNLLGADNFVISSDEKEMKVESLSKVLDKKCWLFITLNYFELFTICGGVGFGRIIGFHHKHSIRRCLV